MGIKTLPFNLDRTVISRKLMFKSFLNMIKFVLIDCGPALGQSLANQAEVYSGTIIAMAKQLLEETSKLKKK